MVLVQRRMELVTASALSPLPFLEVRLTRKEYLDTAAKYLRHQQPLFPCAGVSAHAQGKAENAWTLSAGS
jgi:hypothetical protein